MNTGAVPLDLISPVALFTILRLVLTLCNSDIVYYVFAELIVGVILIQYTGYLWNYQD